MVLAPRSSLASRRGVESSGWWVAIAPQVPERNSLREHDRITATGRWMQEKVAKAVAGDLPPAMMQLHVVVSAQQDSAVDVGAPAIDVVVDVVGFAVRRGPVAPSPAASAVANRECDSLLRREEPLFAPEIEWVSFAVDRAAYGAGFADPLGDQPGR